MPKLTKPPLLIIILPAEFVKDEAGPNVKIPPTVTAPVFNVPVLLKVPPTVSVPVVNVPALV